MRLLLTVVVAVILLVIVNNYWFRYSGMDILGVNDLYSLTGR